VPFSPAPDPRHGADSAPQLAWLISIRPWLLENSSRPESVAVPRSCAGPGPVCLLVKAPLPGSELMHSLPHGPLRRREIPAFPLPSAAAQRAPLKSLARWERRADLLLHTVHRDALAGRHRSGPVVDGCEGATSLMLEVDDRRARGGGCRPAAWGRPVCKASSGRPAESFRNTGLRTVEMELAAADAPLLNRSGHRPAGALSVAAANPLVRRRRRRSVPARGFTSRHGPGADAPIR